ncbi:MAG TPA: DegT/DnrJ/EryC1/StrS family aminotransferase [Deltaproteobacteria bacterium]|nr:MAG: hypothetical protein DRH12_17675 [Deltaproteobacteria bacterium]HDM75380.1 DegT/DnrJ/EryC1/StrS family aminotransferase [Deltaproteobacteria bacterium]
MERKKVLFLDLERQNRQVLHEIDERLKDISRNSSFVCGKYVSEFEELFAGYLNVRYCICVNSGTSALLVSLMAIGIKPGDEVIVPVNTFIATAEAVSILGAKPIFVDVNPDTYLIDPEQIKDSISEDTKAIIPVHLYGQSAEMDTILEIARNHGIAVIEDACQAHGAEYKGRKAGTMGDMGCFSFYPGKNLGAWGEGGAIVTNNELLARKIYCIRNHGGQSKYQHDIRGGNFRMEEIQGAVLGVKIKYLEAWNQKRSEMARLYLEQLRFLEEEGKLTLPSVLPHNKHSFHLFVIQVNTDRQVVIDCLEQNGIQYGIHYPTPLHLTKAFSYLGYKDGAFPVSERCQNKILSLPMGEHLSEMDINYIKEILSTRCFS